MITESPPWALSSLQAHESAIFTNISLLMVVLATLPVSANSLKRSFSTVRWLKIWLQNSMGQEGLSVLFLLAVHRDVDVCPEKVIDFLQGEKLSFRFCVVGT